jgi:hypothetical protein
MKRFAAIALFVFVSTGARAWQETWMFVPDSGLVAGSTEIRREFGVYCESREAAEKLIRFGSLPATVIPVVETPATADETPIGCEADMRTVAGNFPQEFRGKVIVPVREIEGDVREFKILYLILERAS